MPPFGLGRRTRRRASGAARRRPFDGRFEPCRRRSIMSHAELGAGANRLYLCEGIYRPGPHRPASSRRHSAESYIANEKFTIETATQALAAGEADAVAFGKLFIANPDLPRRFALRSALNEPKVPQFYSGGAEGYTDYPPLDSPG